jgi:RNA polymerase sigma factor (sigma-70 family)
MELVRRAPSSPDADTAEQPSNMKADPDPSTPLPSDASGGTSETETIERLFREHNESLVRFLMARLKSRQAALEVAQEAYVRLLSLDQPGAVSFLRAFLFRTAANLAVDRLRRDRVQERVVTSPMFQEFSDTRTPERRVASAQELEHLERLIAQLPGKCREAFYLSRVEGMSCAAIASRMSLSERMVRTYVVRALLFCQTHLDRSGSSVLESDDG